MDILVTKSHISGGAWVHTGDKLLDVDESRAHDLFRNGLARPLIVLRVREPEEKPAKVPKNKAAPNPATKASSAPREDAAAIVAPVAESGAKEPTAALPSMNEGGGVAQAPSGSDNPEQGDATGQP